VPDYTFNLSPLLMSRNEQKHTLATKVSESRVQKCAEAPGCDLFFNSAFSLRKCKAANNEFANILACALVN